jgi:hypothetical protein
MLFEKLEEVSRRPCEAGEVGRGPGAGVICKNTCGNRFQHSRGLTFNCLCNELLPANAQPQSVRLAPLSQFVLHRTRRQQSKLFLIFDRQ